MKREFVVRVVLPDGLNSCTPEIEQLLEQLRYAQLITLHGTEHTNPNSRLFDIHAPKGIDSKRWAEMNADRMRSFGYNAVVAPSTRNVL